MGLQYSKTMSSHAVGNYWVITKTEADYVNLTRTFYCSLFISKEDKDAGADSLGETKVFIKQYASKADMNINALQDGYVYIKANDIELANAIDVLEE